MTTRTPNLPNRKENPMEKTQLKTAQLGTTGLEITRVGSANLELDDDDIAMIEGRT